jgi:hypothetical protein
MADLASRAQASLGPVNQEKTGFVERLPQMELLVKDG